MDELFKEAAKQVPALGLMVVVVFIFIRYIGQQSQNMRDAYTGVMKEHIDERIETRKVILANTQAISAAAESRGELTEVLRDVKEHLRR